MQALWGLPARLRLATAETGLVDSGRCSVLRSSFSSDQGEGFERGEAAGVAEVHLGEVVADVAVAAEDLDGAVRDLERDALRLALGEQRLARGVLALVELELWPNWVRAARDAGAAVCVVNGRLSARSHRGYRRARALLRPTFRSLSVVAAQGQEYADRFLDLGMPASRVRVTGSIKFDGLESDRGGPRTLALRRDLGLDPRDVVFVAGSSANKMRCSKAR